MSRWLTDSARLCEESQGDEWGWCDPDTLEPETEPVVSASRTVKVTYHVQPAAPSDGRLPLAAQSGHIKLSLAQVGVVLLGGACVPNYDINSINISSVLSSYALPLAGEKCLLMPADTAVLTWSGLSSPSAKRSSVDAAACWLDSDLH